MAAKQVVLLKRLVLLSRMFSKPGENRRFNKCLRGRVSSPPRHYQESLIYSTLFGIGLYRAYRLILEFFSLRQ